MVPVMVFRELLLFKGVTVCVVPAVPDVIGDARNPNHSQF